MENSSDDDQFHGRSITLFPLKNGQTIKAVWKETQLIQSIFPGFDRSFRAFGFDKVDWWDLLAKVATGGRVELTGPGYINPINNRRSIRDVFMLPERALAKALLNCVFNKKANISYMRDPITIEVKGSCFEFNTLTGCRRASIIFHALGEPEEDNLRVIIQGTGENLNTHLFQFQPSNAWLCGRFPENCC